MQTTLAELIFIETQPLDDHSLYNHIIWLGKYLKHIGIQVDKTTIIRNQPALLQNALAAAQKHAHIILIIGNLNPDLQNIIQQALAAYLPIHLTHESNIPTAIWYKKEDQVIITLPTLSVDVQQLMQNIVLPRLYQQFSLPTIFPCTIHTVGITLTDLQAQIKNWERALPSYMQLTYLVDLGTISLQLIAPGNVYQTLHKEVHEQLNLLHLLIGPYIYGYDDTTLADAVGQLLKQQGKTIAIAESCTGGYVAHWITQVAGCSAYFQGGMIPYQNETKIQVLGVPATTLQQHESVSEETAIEMAQRIKNQFKSNIGLSTTGLAGPGGGTVDKPVGTIWIAVAEEHNTYTQELQLNGSRLENIQLTAVYLLDLLRKNL